MEFMPRGDHRSSAPTPQPAARPAASHHRHVDWQGRAVRIEWFIFSSLASLILLITIGWLIFSDSTPNSEFKLVDNSKYQAVFLNGGATSGSVAYTTYFGHVTKLNNNYLVLNDVYYLTTANTANQKQTASPQLTKLGCQQLHSPQDQMVVNRSQVAFWENLQDNGKVVTAINDFKTKFPKGPDCSSTSSDTTGTSTQNSATPQSDTTNGNNP